MQNILGISHESRWNSSWVSFMALVLNKKHGRNMSHNHYIGGMLNVKYKNVWNHLLDHRSLDHILMKVLRKSVMWCSSGNQQFKRLASYHIFQYNHHSQISSSCCSSQNVPKHIPCEIGQRLLSTPQDLHQNWIWWAGFPQETSGKWLVFVG